MGQEERQGRVRHILHGPVNRAGGRTQPVLLVAVFRRVPAWGERQLCRLQVRLRNQQDALDRRADALDSAISKDPKKAR